MFTLYFKTKDNADKMAIAQKIHDALRGNDCYINSDVILNADTDNMIMLTVGYENGCDLEKTIDCTEWDVK